MDPAINDDSDKGNMENTTQTGEIEETPIARMMESDLVGFQYLGPILTQPGSNVPPKSAKSATESLKSLLAPKVSMQVSIDISLAFRSRCTHRDRVDN